MERKKGRDHVIEQSGTSACHSAYPDMTGKGGDKKKKMHDGLEVLPLPASLHKPLHFLFPATPSLPPYTPRPDRRHLEAEVSPTGGVELRERAPQLVASLDLELRLD